MWIGDNEGWLSIVKHLDKPGYLLVRARRRVHIEKIFPDADIYENMKADYPYRADILKEDVQNTMVKRIERINYGNFKNSVQDTHFKHALSNVWWTMNTYGLKYRKGNLVVSIII